MIPMLPLARLSSSTVIAYASESSPVPPISSGYGTPSRPRAAASRMISCGNSPLRSSSSATGTILRSAKSRTVRWMSRCCCERAKSIG